MIGKTKITIFGAGRVGETAASQLVEKQLANEIVLIDIIEDMPQGKALDMKEGTPVYGSDTHVWGSNDYKDVRDSDIVVVTAGVPRKPGMDRMDLLKTNIGICRKIAECIKEDAPNAIVIYVANPIDVLTYSMWKITGFAPNKVFGMAGILDTARYRAFISMEANVSVKDIRALTLGGHGDSMVPLPRYTSIGGVPLSFFLPQDKIDAIVNRTRVGGGEIVKLLKFGSAYYAPALAICEMVQAVLRDEKRVLPVVANLEGKYGFSDVYAGAPVILGKDGVEKVLELDLTEEEKAAYQTSVDHVKKGIKELYDEKLL